MFRSSVSAWKSPIVSRNNSSRLTSVFCISDLPDAREGQQIVNQIPHPLCRLGNRRQMAQALFGKRRPGVLLQQFHEAHDMAQRRAQIVGDGITERFQFLVGGLQLRRAFGDALFQLGVERRFRSSAALRSVMSARMATYWRGLPSVVEERHDGRVHPIEGAVLGLVLDLALPDPAGRWWSTGRG